MGIIVKVIRHSNPGLPYLRNMCYYGRDREIARGGYGVNPFDPECAYQQMVAVRHFYSQTSTNPLIHFVVSLDGETDTAQYAVSHAAEIAGYFKDSYQLLWSVHPADPDSSHHHIHIVLHSVNLQTGKLFHSGAYEVRGFAYYVKAITGMWVDYCFEQRENWKSIPQNT